MHFDVRRMFALPLVVILLVTALAACGGNDPTSSPASTPAAITDATTTAASDSTVAPESPGTASDSSTEISGATPQATTSPSDPSSPTTPGTAATGTTDPPPTQSGSDPTSTVAPTQPAVDHRDSPFAYGWNVAMRGDSDGAEHNARTIRMVQDSGFGWIRFQLEWRQFEREPGRWDPLPMDIMIDHAYSQGLQVLLVVTKAPDWALDPTGEQFLADWNDFETFMEFVSNRYRGRVAAWEIWNEQNLAHEMNDYVRVSDYVELLRAGHAGVRAGDPNALIVFGGLTPNGVNDPTIAIDDLLYLQQIYDHNNGEVLQYFDILGVHLNSTHNPPDTMWPDNPSDQDGWNDDDSFYFRRAEQLREVQLAHGDAATPQWITEFGWTTENQAPGYEYGVNNSEEDVAEYLVRSLEIARVEWDFVTGAFVWNLNWSTLASPEAEIYPWSALNEDWSPRPAYTALQQMEKR